MELIEQLRNYFLDLMYGAILGCPKTLVVILIDYTLVLRHVVSLAEELALEE